jgi:hypothetical protein
MTTPIISSTGSKKIPLTQEIIEEFFYNIISEMRNQNIPILNDFKDVFGGVKYSTPKQKIIIENEHEEDYGEEENEYSSED